MIYDFIAKDSPHYAKKTAQDIRRKTNRLDTLPHLGKMVPEIANPNICELHIYSYRILYEIKNDACNILTIIHKRQDFSVENLP
ncbi:MAG: toxin ParE1/3/4 [Candidatus Endobugula sp.]